VTGQVSDGVVPVTILQPEEAAGDCFLMRRLNPICEPPCEPGDTCDLDNTCIPYPAKLDAGTVTVDGLLGDVTMEPDPMLNYYDTSLPNPPFTDGAELTLEAAGADTEAFTIHGFGVEALQMPDSAWALNYDEALVISWTPSDGLGRIWATLNIDQHGNSPVTMFCDLDDTGSTTVPATLVNALIDYGVSGFPSGQLYRRTMDSTYIAAGCVELAIYSHVAAQVTVN
jgi:hypothetical protein